MNILHANAHSIFDYVNGSSNSIRLILQHFAGLGHNVYSVNGCISDSKFGYMKSLSLWQKSVLINKKKPRFLTRFKHNNVNISLIKTRNWQRSLLASDEEENIYRESLKVINECKVDLIIGWGNLLLEESIFKEAKIKDSKICLYLVNPTFKGKRNFIFNNSNIAITDSQSTKKLYKDELNCKFEVVPKLIQPNNFAEITKKVESKNILFVNPSINKGLEPLIILSKYFSEKNIDVSINCVDGRNLFWKELEYLGYKKYDIPKNINILPAIESVDLLFKDIKVLLLLSIWHESGSRLILESYSRGIPVLGFDTGGTSEFCINSQIDLFKKPILYSDINRVIRVKEWNPKIMFERINFLLENRTYYKNYSEKLINNYCAKRLKNKNDKAVEQIIKMLE